MLTLTSAPVFTSKDFDVYELVSGAHVSVFQDGSYTSWIPDEAQAHLSIKAA